LAFPRGYFLPQVRPWATPGFGLAERRKPADTGGRLNEKGRAGDPVRPDSRDKSYVPEAP